jgi:hypothetical protein
VVAVVLVAIRGLVHRILGLGHLLLRVVCRKAVPTTLLLQLGRVVVSPAATARRPSARRIGISYCLIWSRCPGMWGDRQPQRRKEGSMDGGYNRAEDPVMVI